MNLDKLKNKGRLFFKHWSLTPPQDRVLLYDDWIEELEDNQVFVFGSNKDGLHYGGAARTAFCCFGATWGKGLGLSGKSYAIPTMNSITKIEKYVNKFQDFAEEHPEKQFIVTEIGCNIAGYSVEEIAPLFKRSITIENVVLPERFWDELIN